MKKLLVCTDCWTTLYDLSNEEFECPHIGCDGYIFDAIKWNEFIKFVPEAKDLIKQANNVVGLQFRISKSLQNKIKSEATKYSRRMEESTCTITSVSMQDIMMLQEEAANDPFLGENNNAFRNGSALEIDNSMQEKKLKTNIKFKIPTLILSLIIYALIYIFIKYNEIILDIFKK